jgi:CheY-like chemotaxis protein
MARVVVAHDNGEMRELLTELLTELGHQVVGVAKGSDAWQLLRTAPSYMVGVLDMSLPGRHALDLLRKMVADRQVATRHGIILLTTSPLAHTRLLPDSILSDLLADIVVLSMPFDLDDLDRAVKTVAEKQCMTEARR